MDEIKIAHRYLGQMHPPFIIAEMSGNHNQSLERAMAIVEAAAKSGAHALKLQTYTADTMTVDADEKDFLIDDPSSLWAGKSLYDLYRQAYTPWEWHGPIFKRCRELGLICFSTPFDESAVDFLEGLDVPCYKIASFENNHLPLIRKAASTGKPLIISSGMATVAELDEAVRAARDAGCADIILLKCTSSYPASPANSNLRTISHLRELYSVQAGLSDHSLGIGVAIASIAFGATVIEKHFTLSRNEGGVDAAFSLEPAEFGQLAVETERAWQALGTVNYGVSENEGPSLKFRRSLYIVKDVRAGERITPSNVRIVRPGYGLAPKFIDLVMGRVLKSDARKGMPLNWDIIL